MRLFLRLTGQSKGLAFLLMLFVTTVFTQQATGTLRGQIVDEFGGAIVGATVAAVDASGKEKTVATNGEGAYVLGGLEPGRYTVRASAPGFATYENTEVDVAPGRREPLNITLKVTIEEQKVTVAAEPPLSTAPENNAGAIVLRGSDLEALPDDPDDLAAALQALAGPSAGPNGGQLYVDGFSGTSLPPKSSIREIRVNSNPFSAEYDRLGFGRIEIFTKPGTDKLRGQGFFNFTDERLNSRNPFAPTRAPFQARQYGGNLSGPITNKKASFFLDFERREIDDNAVINATILDPNLNVVSFGQSVLTPQRRTSVSPRFDYQIDQKNTLVARYRYTQSSLQNAGVGSFSLASRAFNTSDSDHTLQLTETAVLNQKVVNETRFQYIRRRTNQNGDNSTPTINVLDAFIGGGPQVGLSFNNEDRWELQNTTSWSIGDHSLKAGARLRGVSIKDVSPQNFGGTFTFAGGLATELDANNQVVVDPATGRPALMQITSIERYRRTLLFQQLGLSPSETIARGGGPTQFSISSGNPAALVSQVDLGLFLQDDWRLRPNLTLNFGLRYETQSNIASHFNFAPRIGFAWSPGAGGQRQPKTVVRGGFGIFYERVGESLALQANRFNGTNEQQFIVSDPAVLSSFPNVPSIETLTAFATPQTTWRLAPNIQAPYTMQAVVSVERQLPYKFTLTTSLISARTLHLLRARNINAPLPGTFGLTVPGSGVRPLGDAGNIFEYESTGRLNQNQLIVNLANRFNRYTTLFAVYILGEARSDTDGAGTFPANSYDLSTEYGRSSFDVRHRFIFGGTLRAPWGLSFNPFVIASSGRPFNITTGRDANGDTLFTDRPAFATDLSKPGVIVTRFGAFDPNPAAGEQIIPRNFGTGPSFLTVNLRVSKTFGFGREIGDVGNGSQPGGGGFPRGGGGPRGPIGGGVGGGPRGGGGGGMFGGGTGKRYNLTFSIQAQNLFNRTNAGTPVGNLSSPLFGESNSTAGGFGFGGGGNSAAYNRRLEAQIRFSF